MTPFRPSLPAQPHSIGPQTCKSLAAGLVALLLTACGGGGSGSTAVVAAPVTPVTPVAKPVQVKITAAVTDSTDTSSAPLNGAVITLSTSAAVVPVVATLDVTTGTYTLQTSLDPATLPTSAPVLLTISKPGYETQVIEVLSSQLKAGVPVTEAPIALKPLDPITELAPAEGVALTRVGDNKAPNDEINKYMQTAAVGLSKTIQLGSIDTLVDGSGNLSAYPTMTLSISFRALQTSGCQDDEVRLYQQAQTQGSTPTLIQRFSWNTTPQLIDANVNGSLTLFQPAISTTSMRLSQGPLWLEIKSGLCLPDEYDDFEFVNIHAKFNAASAAP